MKHTKRILALIFGMGFGIFAAYAQHAVNATGGNASNENGSVSYSIGQILYSAYSNSDGNITEGVQQPYEIFVITSIEYLDGIDLKLKAFPNPVDDQLKLLVIGQDRSRSSDFHYWLLDINGKSMKHERMSDKITRIDMSGAQPGVYFLLVTASEERIGFLRIIKR